MANLILMMGVPGSGKSTLAKKLFSKEQDIYVSRDEIRQSIVSPEAEYFSKEKEVFAEFVRQVQAGIDNKEKRFVVADATHLNPASRLKLLDRLNRDLIDTHIIFMKVPLKVAIKRNAKRTGRECVPENTIKSMYNSIAAPIKRENIKYIWVANEKGIVYAKYQWKGEK